tara:strand:- start:107 stop:433 length:327 start_codon:yes stop_codon:yes gene_type:complete
MATTFTWMIDDLERNSSDDGIHHARWICSASETVGTGDSAVTHTAKLGGKTHHTPDPSASDFIAFASVTEANVLDWVQAVVSKSDTETKLQAMIDEKKTPTTATGVPW